MARMRLRHVNVLAVALWHGLYSLIFAIFLGVFYSAYAYLRVGHLSKYVLAYYLVIIPVIYCPLGFLAYAIVAFIYNSLRAERGRNYSRFGRRREPSAFANPVLGASFVSALTLKVSGPELSLTVGLPPAP